MIVAVTALVALLVIAPGAVAALSSTSTSADTLVAGETATYTFGFTLGAAWPADGKFEVTFPAGYVVSGASGPVLGGTCVTGGTLGALGVDSISGQVVTLLRAGGAQCNATSALTVALSSITNPTTAGTTGTFGLRTLQNLGGEIETGAAPAVTITHAAASKLAFTTQPANTVAGATMANVVVTIQDAFDNTATSATNAVTLAPGAGGYTFASGALTQTAASGVATFNDLVINTTGTGYTITATAAGLTGATSTTFDITAGPASTATSTVTASPTSITADGSSASTLTVQLNDANSNNLDATGGTVTFDAPASGSIGVVTDVGDGTYTATYTAPTSTAGSPVTITANLDAAPITDTAEIALTATSSSSSGSSGSSGGGSSTGSHGYQTGYHYSASSASSTHHTVTFQSGAVGTIDVTLDDEQSVHFTVRTRDQSASGLPDGFTSTTIWMDITVTSDADVTTATITLRPLDPDALDGDWQDLVMFHQTDTGWMELPTTVKEQADGMIVVTFTTDDFSAFVLAFDETPNPDPGPSQEESPTPSPMPSQKTPSIGFIGLLVALAAAAFASRRR